jgi:type III restriction enzyme
VRVFRPDFLVRLTSGKVLVLEIKGQDDEQNRTKRDFLAEWVKTVNGHGGFGSWTFDVSRNAKDVAGILQAHR